MLVKASKWLIFSVLMSLIPLAFNYANLLIKGKHPEYGSLIANGEILILVCAMCAGAIGELIGAGSNLRLGKILLGGSAILLLVFSSLLFASIAEARFSHTDLDRSIIVIASNALFISSILTCGACILISEA